MMNSGMSAQYYNTVNTLPVPGQAAPASYCGSEAASSTAASPVACNNGFMTAQFPQTVGQQQAAQFQQAFQTIEQQPSVQPPSFPAAFPSSDALQQAQMALTMAQNMYSAPQLQNTTQSNAASGTWTTQFNAQMGTFVPVFVPASFTSSVASEPVQETVTATFDVQEEASETSESAQPVENKKGKKSKKHTKGSVAEPACYKVFVGGLMPLTNSNALKEHFSKYGKIVGVNVVLDKETKKNRGFGYVEFETDVIASLLKDQHIIDDRKCSVRRFSSACTPNQTSQKSRKYKEPVARKSGYKLFVGGLMPFTNGQALKDHFCKYGKILDVNVVLDKETMKNRGFGYVEFEEDVIDGLLKDVHVIDDRKCGVRRYEFHASK
jgi:RNA recognition motif-containing protein